MYKNKIKPIIQSEAMECGLACITMISVFYGHKTDLTSMRHKYPISLKGSTLESLQNISQRLELESRAIRCEISDLQQLQLPCILHWNLSHYVVFGGYKGRKLVVFDPAIGKLTLSHGEFSKHFSGIALEIWPSTDFQPQTQGPKFKISALWKGMVGLGRSLSNLAIISIILQLLLLAGPFYLQLVVDDAIPRADFGILWILAFGFGFLALLQGISKYLRDITILSTGTQLSFKMVQSLFSHLLYLPHSFFEKRHIGDMSPHRKEMHPCPRRNLSQLSRGWITLLKEQ